MENFSELESLFRDKRVLYITTKNRDYIRVTQEINYLEKIASEVIVIASSAKGYGKRLAYVFKTLISQSMADVDVVFVGFAPQLIMPFFGGKLKKRPVVIDFFISVYDTMVLDRKKFRDGGLLSSFCKSLDISTLKKADYIVCDTKAHGEFFASELLADESKLRVLYLEADKSIYFPRAVEKQKDAPKKVLYFGSILNLQGVETILEAMTLFKDNPDIIFEIIGPIPDHMSKPIQPNIAYIDWLTQQDLAEHIARADLCLAGHFSGDIMKAKRTIPGKAYIYEAMERPMILGDGPANHELFSPDEKHIFVKMGDARALALAINNYFKNEQD
jgi:glycosyltransferase involved in cell wall biosynthesis